jgi:hypothetical protein
MPTVYKENTLKHKKGKTVLPILVNWNLIFLPWTGWNEQKAISRYFPFKKHKFL